MPPVSTPRNIQRLGSINKPALNKPKPLPKTKAQPKKVEPRCCDGPEIVDEDGMKVCLNCGTQLAENNIVADVTFEEDSRGAAQVQGGFIGENARHARTLGAGAYRKVGGGERNSRQEVENNGRRALAPIVQRLSIPDSVRDQALNLFSIVAGFGFNKGRRTEEVAACCLYAACRRNPQNSVLLIDIAEIIKINVFRLGEVYKEMCQKCHYHDQPVGLQHLIDFEPLIFKYCKRLEFGHMTAQVVQDALRIIRRMKRDWIVTGRHPAGLCGACIILAARMNNFKRTIREVVFVSKVADNTVAKRIDEFRRTKAAGLTVDQFRKSGHLLRRQHDPPILQYTKERQEKWEVKKRKRQEYNAQRETVERDTTESPEGGDNASPRTTLSTTTTPPPIQNDEEEHRRKHQRLVEPTATPPVIQQESRLDTDGFAIPALPNITDVQNAANHEVAAEPGLKRGRGRRKKPEPIELSEEELMTERELEQEIDEALNDEEVKDSGHEIERNKHEERAKLLADRERQMSAERERERRVAEGYGSWYDPQSLNDEEITDAEFANDPEVELCLLTEEESRIKEQIWIAHNEDWLRAQHEKQLIKQIDDANRAEKEKSGRGRDGKVGRKKRSKMGDRSVLQDAETPIDSPADAVEAMLQKRGGAAMSKFIDYEQLSRIYGDRSHSMSASQSRAPSEAPSADSSVVFSARTQAQRETETPAPQRPPSESSVLQSPRTAQRINATDIADMDAPNHDSHLKIHTSSIAQNVAHEGAEEEGDQEMQEEEVESRGYQSDNGEGPSAWADDISDVQDYGDDDNEEYERAIGQASWGDSTFEGDEYDYE